MARHEVVARVRLAWECDRARSGMASDEVLWPADFVLKVPDSAESPSGQLMFLPFHHAVEEFTRVRL